MITISLCMIVKDEENAIGRCLNTVKDLVDEIIIVDTGSKDKTKEKVKSYGAKVFDFKWVDDFALARNYAFSKASKDYILWLDADDVIEKSEQEKFKKLKDSLTFDIDVVSMKYILAVDENNNPVTFLRRNRLVKRSNNYIWIGKVHEYLSVYGNILNADILIRHLKDKEYTDRNLKIYRKMILNNEKFSPREIFYYGNELYDNGYYIEAIEQYKKFIESDEGWVEDVKQAINKISDCYKYIGNDKEQIKYLLKALEYDIPSSELCCKIAYYFFERDNYNVAIFWYKLAMDNGPKDDEIALVNGCMSTWVPALQLCVCYCKIGQYKIANDYNEMAAVFMPNHSSVINNREYLLDKI